MYKPYTVALFGHRQLFNARLVEERLAETVLTLLRTHGEVEFLLGRNGDFDLLAASVIRRVRREYGDTRSTLTLVLPYMTAEYRDNEQSFLDYYDEVEIFPAPLGMPAKACFSQRNRSMVDRADQVLAFVEQERGGAYDAVEYARETGRKVTLLSKDDCI